MQIAVQSGIVVPGLRLVGGLDERGIFTFTLENFNDEVRKEVFDI